MATPSKSEEQTRELGYKLGKKFSKGFFCLYGDLGSGKTTFVRGLAKALGIKNRIQSPTFTYQRVHNGKNKLYHFDFYRFAKSDTLLLADIQEAYERNDGAIAVEWAERIVKALPEDRIDVVFEYVDEGVRRIKVKYQ